MKHNTLAYMHVWHVRCCAEKAKLISDMFFAHKLQ